MDEAAQLTAKDLSMKHFFGKDRSYFIQVVGHSQDITDDQFLSDEEEQKLKEARLLNHSMHGHYYHLKKMLRKKSQPLYPLKLDIRDF